MENIEKKQLVFATGNAHKVAEVNEILAHHNFQNFEVVTMRQIGQQEDLPETSGTILGNSQQKARFLFQKFGCNCFSEDTGLEIDALDNAPGVDTAHYSGTRDATENMNLVLKNMAHATRRSERTARFRTVITLILDGHETVFEGICEGIIRPAQAGDAGFGYDPIFEPRGFSQTFAQLPNEVKNSISHRAKATDKLLQFLKNQ
ncbi:MAG: hypothetical protein RL757_2255 [Bacteroidota bacterium]|jgi:XTP/dITP diphosphohydrolase